MVLVGAGHAHVEVLRSFARSPPEGVDLTLVTRTRNTPYSGMLPGFVAGLYRYGEMAIDTLPLATAAGAKVLYSEAIGLDTSVQSVRCRDLAPIRYDVVSFDIGSAANTKATIGASEHAVAVRPIDLFAERFESLRSRVQQHTGPVRLAVVGGGAAGVELILSIAARLRRDAAESGHRGDDLKFILIAGAPGLLPEFPRSFRRKFVRFLAQSDIEVLDGTMVTAVERGRLQFERGPALAADEILWVTEADAPEWLRSTGLRLDRRGFIEVNTHLQACGFKNVFAAGDIASFAAKGLPKSGVYAVREGPVLVENLRNFVTGHPFADYRPQRNALYLVSTGRRHAVGTRDGLVVAGKWVWRFKDWLDRRWIAQYQRFSGPPAG